MDAVDIYAEAVQDTIKFTEEQEPKREEIRAQKEVQ